VAARLASIRVGAGISTRRSGLAAAEDALGAAIAPLDGAIPDLAFLFVAPQFEDELEGLVPGPAEGSTQSAAAGLPSS